MDLISILILVPIVMAHDTIVRQEYGVVFAPVGSINTATSTWHHTFAYDLSFAALPDIDITVCEESLSSSHLTPHSIRHMPSYCQAVFQSVLKASQLRKDIRKSQEAINLLMPRRSSARVRRGLFDFVGQASKYLFGTSTTRDTKILQEQIELLQSHITSGRRQIEFVTNATRSVLHQMSRRQDVTNQALELLNNRTINYATSLEASINRTQGAMNMLNLFNVNIVDTLIDIRHEMTQELYGIQTLLDGYLPVTLIPPHSLVQVLSHLHHQLQGSSFRLAWLDIAPYYKSRDITYHRQSNYLYVTIRIPLESVQTTYNVFRISTLPIRAGKEQTQIKFPEPYLALSNDNYFYLTMSESDYLACAGDHVRRCMRGFAIKETSQPSCLFALFENDHVLIKQLCDFKYLLNSDQVASKVIPINDNSYLVSTNDTNWLQTCPFSTPMYIKPCSLCIVTLPCSCSLKSRTFFIPACLDRCNSSIKSTVTYVSHNLASLIKFYEDILPTVNLSQQILQSPVPIKYPKLALKSTKFDQVLKDSSEMGISVNHAIDKVKIHKRLYSDSVSYLYESLGPFTNSVVTTGLPALSTFTFILSVCTLLLSIRNALVMSALVRPVAAAPWYTLSGPSTTVSSLEVTCKSSGLAISMVYVPILVLCLGIFVYMYRKYRHVKKQHLKYSPLHTVFSIVFMHNSGRLITDLEIVNVPFALDEFQFTAHSSFTRPIISRLWWKCSMRLNWDGIRCTSTSLGSEMILPSNIAIPWPQRRKIMAAVEQATAIQLRMSSAGRAVVVRTWVGDQIIKQ